MKSASPYRLNNERTILKKFKGQSGIRQLVDEIPDPQLLVLQYFDDNLLDASGSKQLEKHELRFIARKVLQALQALHSDGYVHTGMGGRPPSEEFSFVSNMPVNSDVKPDNVLFNYGDDSKRFTEVALGDYGDTCRIDLNADSNEDGHIIGTGLF